MTHPKVSYLPKGELYNSCFKGVHLNNIHKKRDNPNFFPVTLRILIYKGEDPENLGT